MTGWLVSTQGGILLFLAILLLIGLTNLFFWRRIERYGEPAHFPRVAVLVPARNEEVNIERCIRSLLAQDYRPFEVLALDDHSTDRTRAILLEISRADSRLRVLDGQPLPPGWLGKHWACHQLAQAADADLILFVDADTLLHPQALRNAVAALLAEGADLVTALPRERVESPGEQLSVPLLPWSIFFFLPLGLAHRLRFPPLSATVGQFMLLQREAYNHIGGHAAVRENIADDLALGRRIIRCGGRWRLLDGARRVECRMYHNWSEAYEGFSKNLYAAFDCRPWLFIPAWLWLVVVYWTPLVLALTGNAYAAAPAILLSLLLEGLFCWRFGFPLYLAPLYPVRVAVALLLAFRSLALTLTGRATWKGRLLNATSQSPQIVKLRGDAE